MATLIDYRGKTPIKQSFGIPLITAKIVKNGRIEDPNEFISEEDYKSWMTRGYPKVGDVVITTEAPTGEVAQLISDRIALAQRIVLLRGKSEQLDNTYLKYCLMTEYVQSQIHARGSGTTVVGIKQSELRKIQVIVPTFPEQQNIAKVLGNLDSKIELNRKMNATLEQMAQAFFKSWFVDFDPVKAKAAGQQPEGMDAETDVLFPSEFEQSELGMIPKGWVCSPLNEVIEITPTRRLSKDQVATYLDMANVPTQGHRPIACIKRAFNSGTKFKNGDTLLARITPCLENGKTAFVDFLFDEEIGWGSTEFIVLCPKAPLPDYFAYLLCRDQSFRNFATKSMTGTSGRQRVQIDLLGQYILTIALDSVYKEFDRITKSIIRKISQNDEEIKILSEIRDTLLPRLISGQLRIPDIEQI